MKTLFILNFHKWFDVILIFLIFALLPTFVSTTIVVHMLVFGIVAMAMDLMYGYGGLLSFGHALLLGLGCYGTAFALNHFTDNILVAVISGIALSVSVTSIVGIFVVRKRDPYFALLMLAFNVFFYQLWIGPLAPWTGSDLGLVVNLPIVVDRTTRYYLMILLPALLAIVLMKIFLRSRLCSLLIATSESEEKVKALGHDPFKIKYVSLLYSAFLSGMAGSLICLYLGYIGIDYISPFTNPIIVFSALIGGSGTLLGPFIGSILYFALTYGLIMLLGYHASIYLEGIIGVALIVVVLRYRGGLYRTFYKLITGYYKSEPMR
ncbi:MAG: branched-chain amino acid ABC transporter permease [Ignisphaera sp.]